jgi:hypothetical protein
VSTTFKRQSIGGRVLTAIVLLGAVVGAGVYYYLYPEELPAWAAKTSIGRDMQTATVYKWQDASGNWHVSDQPPPEGTDYKAEKYSRDTNVVPLPPELQQ